jgi:hypothetical protein
MSTRANIGLLRSNGTVRMIYTHWDGYPRHHGPILLKNFYTVEKVNALLDLGDLSILDESIEKPVGHCYDRPADGHCVAYKRDRGEDGTDAKEVENESKALDLMEEYLYLFDERTNRWKVSDHDSVYIWLDKVEEVQKQMPPEGWPSATPVPQVPKAELFGLIKNGQLVDRKFYAKLGTAKGVLSGISGMKNGDREGVSIWRFEPVEEVTSWAKLKEAAEKRVAKQEEAHKSMILTNLKEERDRLAAKLNEVDSVLKKHGVSS